MRILLFIISLINAINYYNGLILKLFFCLLLITISLNSHAQCPPLTTANCLPVLAVGGSEFIRSTSGNVDFTFDNFSKYNGGITFSGSTLLRLKVLPTTPLCKWVLRMYIDNNGTIPITDWETSATYGGSGATPTLDLIQIKVYNGCNTPINSGMYQSFLPANGAFIDIINDAGLFPIAAGSCMLNVNGAGSYLTNYNEYSFTIDYRIVPGLTHKPGMYQFNIRFCLVEE